MDLKDSIATVKHSEEDAVTLIVGSFYVYGTVVNELKKNKKNF